MKNTKPQQAVAAPTIEQIFQQAVTCHHAGQLHGAECLYHIVLQTQSGHADAKHNLSLLKEQLEQATTSLPNFKAALEANPDQGQHWLNYIDALILTGQMDEARQILQQGRQHGLEGEMVGVLSERLENNCQHLSTETSATAESHQSSSNKAPPSDQIDALIDLFNTGRHAEAIVAAQQMTQSFPHDDFGWKALGTLYKQIGQTVDALHPLQRAAELSPNDAETLNNLSITYQELKQVDKAEQCCRQALQIKPDDVSALNNLSNTLDDLGRLNEAEKFAAHGITRDRLEIGYHTPPWDVLRSIDIGLDCFPHNSGATLFETLYMGIPYVTLAGRPSVGRLGSCILQGIGHPEWIATSEDEYVTKVVELASDVSRLSEIRATLRNQMECSPLRDEAGFASKVEAAYRSMWKTWCEKMK